MPFISFTSPYHILWTYTLLTQVHVPEAHWGQTNWNVGVWNREQFIARPPEETRWLMPWKAYSSLKGVLSRFSRVRLCAAPWTLVCQAPLSMGFSRREHWSGCLAPPPGDLSNPGIKPASLTSPALAGRFFTTSANPEGFQQSVLKGRWGEASQGGWSAYTQFSDWGWGSRVLSWGLTWSVPRLQEAWGYALS